MTSYRCQHCTLMRCDAPNETCSECLANIGGGPVTSPGVTYVYSIDSWMLGSPVVVPTITPGGVPTIGGASALPVGNPNPTNVKQDLKSLSLDVSARIVRDWVHDAIKNWAHTQKGDKFWVDVWSELNQIGSGRTP